MNTKLRNLMINIKQGRDVPGWEDHEFVFWAQYDKFCFLGWTLCMDRWPDRMLVTGLSTLDWIEAEDFFRTIGRITPPGTAHAREFDRHILRGRESLYEHVKRGIAIFMFQVAWGRYPAAWESLPMNFVDFSR